MNDSPPAILGGRPAFARFVPIVRPTLPEFQEIAPAVQSALASGMITRSDHVAALEAEVAQALAVKHAVALNSCTSGLMLLLKALDLRGEVIIPSFTFMATGTAVLWAGLKPVFADVDPETATLSPAAVESRLTPETCAILAVHTFGAPADVAGLEELAPRHSLKLLFDAAHGLGSIYRGRPVGGFGDAEAFSMSPTKLVVAAEGGLVTTNDDELARRLKVGREYGNPGDYDCEYPGLSARLEEFNALLARWSLAHLEAHAARRRQLVRRMREVLADTPGVHFQKVPDGCQSSYKDCSLEIVPEHFGLNRDQLAVALRAENVDSRKYFYPLLHQTKAFAPWARELKPEDLPHSSRLSARSLSLPIWSHMLLEVAEKIAAAVAHIGRQAGEIASQLGTPAAAGR